MKKNLSDHKFINLLKYAVEHENFTVDDIQNKLNLTPAEASRYISNVANKSPNDEKKWSLRYEAFINYLEYIELKEARKSSKYATWLAIIAIAISIITNVTSCNLTKKQMNTPIQMHQDQMNEIKKSIYKKNQ